ncbi:hypothetical protein [Methyloceanibacter sp.]|uniref:hypothetical protein n=1 Tax=Methyloceanibacter sp. TaxID=1965321 RepID=UPI00356A8D8B
MIYLDTSVALAQLLAEDRARPPSLWREPLIASRLLEYEIWTRLNAQRLERSHSDDARALIQRVALIELAAPVLARALEPFPIPVRTLDARRGQTVELASYDDHLLAAAKALGVPIAAL